MYKRLIILPTLALLFYSTQSLATPVLFPVADGGISGGGGFFLDAQKPSDSASGLTGTQALKNAYKYIYTTTEAFERAQPIDAPDTPTLSQFLSHPQLHQTLEKIKPLDHDKGSCLNKFYNEVDGSTYSFAPNTICISTYNLQYAVAESDRYAQAVGLLIHEYAEVIGMSEDDAIRLQKQMIEHLRK